MKGTTTFNNEDIVLALLVIAFTGSPWTAAILYLLWKGGVK